MSDEKKGIASAADLLALSGGQKTVTLKTCGWDIKIRKVNVGELSDIMNSTGSDAITQFILLSFKGLVEPKMDVGQLKQLPHDILIEIGAEIAKFSGLDKASVEKMRNLLGIEPAGPSS